MSGSVNLTWFGHATWLLCAGDDRILIDPFLTENPKATVGPDEVKANYIAITHGHFDHIADAADVAKANDATIIANYEIATWFAKTHGIDGAIGMNLGGAVSTSFGKVEMTIAHHSSELPDGSYGGSPGGFLFETMGRRLYFAGDTALFLDMQLIGEGGLDLAVLPIGDLFTMGPEASVRATKMLNPKKVVPGHYGTWPPIEQDPQAWASLVSEQTDAEPVVLKVNETIEL